MSTARAARIALSASLLGIIGSIVGFGVVVLGSVCCHRAQADHAVYLPDGPVRASNEDVTRWRRLCGLEVHR